MQIMLELVVVVRKDHRHKKGAETEMKRLLTVTLVFMFLVIIILSLVSCSANNNEENQLNNSNKKTSSASIINETDEQILSNSITLSEPVFYTISKKYSNACSHLTPSKKNEVLYKNDNLIRYWTKFSESKAQFVYWNTSGTLLSEEDVCMNVRGPLNSLFTYNDRIKTVRDFEEGLNIIKDSEIIDSSSLYDLPSNLEDHTFCRIMAKFDIDQYKDINFIIILDVKSLNEKINEKIWAEVFPV